MWAVCARIADDAYHNLEDLDGSELGSAHPEHSRLLED
jgi:hypothetical protein